MCGCVITHLFIQQNFIEYLLCILDIRDTIVKTDEKICPREFTLLGKTINRYII